MPSCSSKLSIPRENEFSIKLNKLSDYPKANWHLFFGAAPNGHLWWLTKTVTSQKVFWCCFERNVVSAQYFYLWQICLVLKYCILNVVKLKKPINSNVISVFKCETSKVKNTFHQTYILIVLKLYNHNVIWLMIVYFLLRISSYFILLNELKLLTTQTKNSKHLKNKIICVSNGIRINSVMELDETVKEINSCIKNLPTDGKSQEENSSVLSSDDDKPDDHLTVINDNQIMKKSDYSQVNNSVLHENSIDVKIKEEKQEDVKNELLPNGDLNLNCLNNCNDLDFKKSVDFAEVLEPNNKKLNLVKDITNGNNDEVIANAIKCEYKNTSNDIVKNCEVKAEEDIKSRESSAEKDKCKHKNQCTNSTATNHLSSASLSSSLSNTSKKNCSQTHQSSSSSSSSSRHKYKDARDDKHKSSSSTSSSSSRNNEMSTRSLNIDDKSKSGSRSKSRSCHHKPEEKCHCKSRHRSHHHSKSKKLQSVKTQCSADEIAFELRQSKIDSSNPYFTRVPWVPHPQLANLKYGRFYRIEEDRNGGATVCHLYMDEISHLPENQLKECAIEFVKLSYSEDENECAYHVMGIVHGAASYLPDLVDYMADHYPTLTVKTGSLASRDNHTTTMSQYRDEVYKTYSNGTFRYAPLDQLSICGVLGEEVGAYFPDFVARLEQSPFMKPVMPWSFLSVVQTDNPRESNDGPIFWVRPGEQMLPANEALKESTRPKKRRNNELDNLAYIGGSRFSEARESLFMDRTKAHADQVGVDYGISNTAPTAAVGVLKAVNCGHPEHGNRATKDVVAFHAQDYSELLEILMLDLYEPPQTQCTKWIEVSKLNTLRREGIRYAHLQLHDNDVYYLPRKIIHQFQTISSVASVAWHIRYRDYFSILGAPNLHTPTGINKGQVFYEKKNVAVYCPPIRENDFLSAVTNSEGGLKTPKKSDRLKEYSPFKHSPRKTHKHQSPRSTSKKEKQADSVSLQSNNVEKRESELMVNDHEKKSSNSTKKIDRSDSTDETRRERDEESRRTAEKSGSSSNRRSSSDHTPSKKEKSQDSHSNHRKEVKNLESEFSFKKDKSKRDKSPKSKHRSSDESKHRSSKQRRHEKSSKSSSSKQEKNREHESSSNGQNLHKTKTDEKNEESSRKRKHGESSHHTPIKKIKDNSNSEIIDSAKTTPPKELNKSSENQVSGKVNLDFLVIKKENDSGFRETKEEEQSDKSVINNSETNEVEKNSSENSISKIQFVKSETNSQTNVNNGSFDVDLRQDLSFPGFISPVPPLPPQPPPPANSPPVNPPLPPSSPTPETTSEKSVPDSQSSYTPQKLTHVNNLQENCISSKDKTDAHAKRVKKKAKKGNDSYDLLGDIMSKMDKKKL